MSLFLPATSAIFWLHFMRKNMGIPIAKLICASNENKVLYDFFSTGTYDKNREFMLTSSPSMDILISSNLERLIYRIAGNDAEKNAALMRADDHRKIRDYAGDESTA